MKSKFQEGWKVRVTNGRSPLVGEVFTIGAVMPAPRDGVTYFLDLPDGSRHPFIEQDLEVVRRTRKRE